MHPVMAHNLKIFLIPLSKREFLSIGQGATVADCRIILEVSGDSPKELHDKKAQELGMIMAFHYIKSVGGHQ